MLKECHDELYSLSKNGKLISKYETGNGSDDLDELRNLLNLSEIFRYADEVDISDIRGPLTRQVELNRAIAEEGLRNSYGYPNATLRLFLF